MFEWHKKEKPFLGMAGLGGGVGRCLRCGPGRCLGGGHGGGTARCL